MAVLPTTIQLISIIGAALFMLIIFRLIAKGKLREEYSIVWILCTLLLIIFSIWRKGLEKIALFLGVYYAPSLIFLGAFFAVAIFLVHLSLVNSKLQNQIKSLAHEIAFIKNEIDSQKKKSEENA
ncbi:DUF2304 domain-containing protein [Arsenicibacter rosenii]|uniref:DUF2304 domain-containing protein n=1 Tax=Arsenicibacter rosenii TaxID=1750698 RepID=A0A1S2VC98_9BACT|nr:DUF2304 domain-containing protein [Arsenicibacter rosenii]OIN56361.1 hypothetical protein BLX24_25370 [Arsenicibacter rosenii]